MKGLVIKKNAGLYDVETANGIVSIKASGNVKKAGLYVGDYVEFDEVINKVYERKNHLIRPPLSNLDKLFIVFSSVPKPDYVLIDKLILYCFVNGIEPCLVLNKQDLLDTDFINEVKNIYKGVAKVIVTSAHNKSIEALEHEIVGISAFAGQSAVGKSSLINALFNNNQAEVGNLSKKVERGKQTTRMTCLYKKEKGYIADTAGFSLLDARLVLNITAQELSRYYPDFLKFIINCKYRSCLHENSENCGIIEAVKQGKINKTRYDNYLKILNDLK